MIPSGLTSMSSGLRRACKTVEVSGENADVPRPWYDCVQSIGSPEFGSSAPGASGRGTPETAGTGVRVSDGAAASGEGGVELDFGVDVEEAGALVETVDAALDFEVLTRVRIDGCV